MCKGLTSNHPSHQVLYQPRGPCWSGVMNVPHSTDEKTKARRSKTTHPRLPSKLLADSALHRLRCSHFQTNECSAGPSYQSRPFPLEVLPKGSQVPLVLPGAERGRLPPSCCRAAPALGEGALQQWEPGERAAGDSSALRARQRQTGLFPGEALTRSQVDGAFSQP